MGVTGIVARQQQRRFGRKQIGRRKLYHRRRNAQESDVRIGSAVAVAAGHAPAQIVQSGCIRLWPFLNILGISGLLLLFFSVCMVSNLPKKKKKKFWFTVLKKKNYFFLNIFF